MQDSTDHLVPELRCVLHFLQQHPDTESWPSAVPLAGPTSLLKHLQSSDAASIERCLEGEGMPALITDALGPCAALPWSFERFGTQHASLPVRANNRAPARHADFLPGGGGAQRSVHTTLGAYVAEHVQTLPASLEAFAARPPASTPFYLNGWRAFVEELSLAADFPMPAFAAAVDHTVQLLEAIDAQMFGKSAAGQQAGGSAWCRQVDANLTKLFLGPPGTISRLHYDAGDAHGWLAQVVGRKLFVLYPPSDGAKALYPLASETETVQSPVEPLQPDMQRWPGYAAARPLACVVHPGEAVLIPCGWWHYAVALDRSITVQRNFYHARSNAAGLVRMVAKTAAALRNQ